MFESFMELKMSDKESSYRGIIEANQAVNDDNDNMNSARYKNMPRSRLYIVSTYIDIDIDMKL